jgi:2-methylisocitrate lyase-like PEP mutase family enzyme
VSLGDSLARVAWGAFMRAATDLAEHGRFDTLKDTALHPELNTLFRKGG